MGNDGGSIPDRRDLVRNKPKVGCHYLSQLRGLTTTQAEQADKANQTRAKWFFCALSKVRPSHCQASSLRLATDKKHIT
jgi:hypothetical protein